MSGFWKIMEMFWPRIFRSSRSSMDRMSVPRYMIRPPGDPPRRPLELQDRKPEGGFSAARFPDEAQGLPVGQGEGDVLHGAHDPDGDG